MSTEIRVVPITVTGKKTSGGQDLYSFEVPQDKTLIGVGTPDFESMQIELTLKDDDE